MSKATAEAPEATEAGTDTGATATETAQAAPETPAAPAAPAVKIDKTKWKHVKPEEATESTPAWQIMSRKHSEEWKFGEATRTIKTGAPKPFASCEEFVAFVKHVQASDKFILISGYEQDPIDENSLEIKDGVVHYKTRGQDGNKVTSLAVPLARLHVRPFVHELPWAMIPLEKRFWVSQRSVDGPKPKAEKPASTRTRKAKDAATTTMTAAPAPTESIFSWDGDHVGTAEGGFKVRLDRTDEGKVVGYASVDDGEEVELSFPDEVETRPEAHEYVEEMFASGELQAKLGIAPAGDSESTESTEG